MAHELAGKVLRYRWPIFATMCLAYIFVYFHRLCPNVVALDIKETFQASAGLLGLMASGYFYPYAFMQLPSGLLSDSLGPRKAVTVFLIFAGLGSLLFGLAWSMEVAVAARVVVGIGVSVVFIPTMKIISQWFRPREFASMAAIVNVMGGVGVLTASAPLAWMAANFGWRLSFEIIGAATFLIAVLVYVLVRNKPQDLGWPSIAEIDHTGPQAPAEPVRIGLMEGALRVVKEPRFWAVAIWFFLDCAIFFGFGGLWAGPYLQHVYELEKEEAGAILSMIAFGLILGSPFMSFLSDRIFMSRKKVLFFATGSLTLLLLVLTLVPSGLPIWSLYIVFFLFCVFSSAIVVIGFTTTKELFPVEIAGTSVGTVNLFPFLGGAVMQVVLGLVIDAYPATATGAYPLEAYVTVLQVLLVSSAVAFVCIFFMKETFPNE